MRTSQTPSESSRRAAPGHGVLILVCRGPECGDKRNSRAVHDELKARLATAPPPEVAVHLDWQSCFGKCARGVNVMVRELRPGEGEEEIHRSVLGSLRGGVIYNAVTPGDVPRIVAEHVVGGRVIGEFRNRDPLP